MLDELRIDAAAEADRWPRPGGRVGAAVSRLLRKEAVVAYLLILPAMVFYVGFLALPTLGTIASSLFSWSGNTFNELHWVGVHNYSELANDSVFREALVHNLIFIGVGATLIVGIGLGIAVLLEQGFRGSSFFRAAFFVPTVLSLVVVSLVFSLILSPDLGLINPFLESIGLGGLTHAWLGDPQTALGSVIAVEVWRDFGFAMLIFIAGLRSLDTELFAAARTDGAGALQLLRKITVPMLKPVVITVAVLITIGLLKLFDIVYLMTNGGPNHKSEVLSTWMYTEAFTYKHFGYGAAIAVVLLLMTVVVGIVQLRVSRDDA